MAVETAVATTPAAAPVAPAQPPVPQATAVGAPVSAPASRTKPYQKATSAADMRARVLARASGMESAVPPEIAAVATAGGTPAEAAATVATPAEPPKVDAQGRAHAPDGKYVAEGATEGATPAEPPAAQAPAGIVVEIPEGHPLRARRTSFTVNTEQEANDLRGALNASGPRKSRVNEVEQERDSALLRAARADAEAAFWRDNSASVFSPEFFQQYADIKDTYGPDAAERFKRGHLLEAQGQVDEATNAAESQVSQQALVRSAQEFTRLAVTDALGGASPRYPRWSVPEVQSALKAFGSYIYAQAQNGRDVPLTATEWYRFADVHYALHPQVQAERGAALTAAAERKANEAAQARERERIEKATNSQRVSPLSGIPNVQTGLTSPSGVERPKSFQAWKQGITERAKGIMPRR